jgi:ribosome-associated protein
LPPFYKERLLKFTDHRIAKDDVVIIKAKNFRNQEQNKEDALQRLKELILASVVVQKKRRPTKPSRDSQKSAWIGKRCLEGIRCCGVSRRIKNKKH